MSSIDERKSHGRIRFPTRRAYAWLAAAVMIFAVYASLLPLEFRGRSLDSAWAIFQAVMMRRVGPVSRINFIANILLFVPIGFGLMGAFLIDRVRRAPAMAAVFPTLAISLLLSISVEFLQLFVPQRVPSRDDIVAQTIGCLIGVAGWMAVGPAVTRWFRETSDRSQGDRLAKALVVYAAVWVFVNLAPFDVTLDVDRLGRRLSSGAIVLVPFGNPNVSLARLVWDAVSTTLAAIPLGVFGLIGGTGRVARRHPVQAFFFGSAFVVLIEAAQIFITSHAADMTDVLCGGLGVATGVWAGFQLTGSDRIGQRSDVPGWSIFAAVGCAALVCAYHWLPFDFVVNADMVRGKLGRLSLIPFAGYRAGSDLNALNTLLAKLGVCIPLGVVAAFLLRRWRETPKIVMAGWMVVATVFFAIVEIGQLFLPSRMPDPTDVLIGVVGSCLGLLLGRWMQRTSSLTQRGRASGSSRD